MELLEANDWFLGVLDNDVEVTFLITFVELEEFLRNKEDLLLLLAEAEFIFDTF